MQKSEEGWKQPEFLQNPKKLCTFSKCRPSAPLLADEGDTESKEMGNQSPGSSCWASPQNPGTKTHTKLFFSQHYKLIFIALEPKELCQYGTRAKNKNLFNSGHPSQLTNVLLVWFSEGVIRLNCPWQPPYQLFRNPDCPRAVNPGWYLQDCSGFLLFRPRCTRVLLWGGFGWFCTSSGTNLGSLPGDQQPNHHWPGKLSSGTFGDFQVPEVCKELH